MHQVLALNVGLEIHLLKWKAVEVGFFETRKDRLLLALKLGSLLSQYFHDSLVFVLYVHLHLPPRLDICQKS